MITEVHDAGGSAPGQMTVPLLREAPKGLEAELVKFGHIMILPNEVDPVLIGDDGVKAKAIYAGVVLEVVRNDTFQILGEGMAHWLGDETGLGELLEGVTLSSVTLDSALTSILPAVLDKGTISVVAGLTGEFYGETPLEALRTLSAAYGFEFRVNPDGTVDAGPEADLFPSSTTPTTIITREESGDDPGLNSLETEFSQSHTDARPYITRAILVGDDGSTRSIDATRDRTGGTTYYGMNGSAMVRARSESLPSGSSVSAQDYLQALIDAGEIFAEHTITTNEFDIDGRFKVGDTVVIYDPPAFYDPTADEFEYRGQLIRPLSKRMLVVDWPLTFGQGVYYRPPDASVTGEDYIDLTRFVDWERR